MFANVQVLKEIAAAAAKQAREHKKAQAIAVAMVVVEVVVTAVAVSLKLHSASPHHPLLLAPQMTTLMPSLKR